MAPKSGNRLPGDCLNLRPELLRFADLHALNRALVGFVTQRLRAALVQGHAAALAVPGGRTPVPLFDQLSNQALEWARVGVTLTDERWVDLHDAASNERLVREHLLRNAAAPANLVGLRGDAAESEAGATVGATQAWQRLAVIQRPFDVVILGMGEDGHFASLFPGDAGSTRGLDLSVPPGCVAVHAPVAPSLRVSLNLAALLQARHLVLLVTGDRKWDLLQRELDAGRTAHLPVRALLAQDSAPLTVYWAP